jgi:hypothetical protein
VSDLFGDGLSERVPVITLWQPWASLIFTGDKKHETRAFPFPAKYAGKHIAIHAAKGLPSVIPMGLHLVCEREWGDGSRWREEAPRGAILGTVRLVHAISTDTATPGKIDRACGDWSPGRYAWLFEDVRRLPDPLPARGKQGWWSIEASALLEAA